jgi:hypothetical protein
MAEVCDIGNVEPIEVSESVAVVYGNMDDTGTYLQERFTALNEYINDEVKYLSDFIGTRDDNLALKMDNMEIKLDLLLADANINQDRRHLLDAETVPAVRPTAKPSLDVEVEIVGHNPRSFFCLTTSEGAETETELDASFELTVFDAASEKNVAITTFAKVGTSIGGSLIKIPETVEGQIFVLKVGTKDLLIQQDCRRTHTSCVLSLKPTCLQV